MRHTSLFLILILARGLTSCAPVDTSPPFIDDANPIRLSVGTIESYATGDKDVPTYLRPSAEALTRMWLEKRLKAAGNLQRRFVIEIEDAVTVQNPIATSPHFDSYTTTIGLSFRLYEPDAHLSQRHASITTRLTRELEADASIAKRDTFFADMARAVVAKMEQMVPAQLEQHFDDILSTPAHLTPEDSLVR